MLVLMLVVGVLPAAAITGGELDEGRHPNVGLMYALDEDGERLWRCSGTLIEPRVFLTAGHCVEAPAARARVWFDGDLTVSEEYPDGGETSIEGTPIPHPEYDWGDSDPHDVGVVILDEAPAGIEPALLPDPDLLTQLKKDRTLEGGYEEGVYFKSVGYGRILESWPPPELVSSPIRRVSESEFVALTKVFLHLSQKAVFEEEGSCFGDSGGPILWTDPNGNEIIVALTSTGDAQCVATGLDYRVDVSDTRQWILDQFP
jgi:hypothetical protein